MPPQRSEILDRFGGDYRFRFRTGQECFLNPFRGLSGSQSRFSSSDTRLGFLKTPAGHVNSAPFSSLATRICSMAPLILSISISFSDECAQRVWLPFFCIITRAEDYFSPALGGPALQDPAISRSRVVRKVLTQDSRPAGKNFHRSFAPDDML